MIISVIEIIELPNLGYMTTSTRLFESHYTTLLVTPWKEVVTSSHLFQNIFILGTPGVSIFADIIKITTMFVKTVFKDSKKLEELEIMHQMQSISVFLDMTKVANFR